MHEMCAAMETRWRDEAGFSMIEIMIAIAIFSIGVMGVASLQVSAISGNAGARRIADVMALAESHLEELMALDYTDAKLDPATNPHQEVDPDYPSYTSNWNIFMVDLDGDGVDDAKRIQLTVIQNGNGNRTATLHHMITQSS
jgi:type IV pilus assembly protein PilV